MAKVNVIIPRILTGCVAPNQTTVERNEDEKFIFELKEGDRVIMPAKIPATVTIHSIDFSKHIVNGTCDHEPWLSLNHPKSKPIFPLLMMNYNK